MSALMLVVMVLAWSGALWLGAQALCQLAPTPKQAQAIWRAAAALSVLPFVATLFIPTVRRAAPGVIPDLPQMDALVVTAETAGELVLSERVLQLPSLSSVVLAVLIIGWAARGALWLIGHWRLRLVKAASRASDLSAAHWAARLGLKRAPEVRLLNGGTPFVTGLARPVIYLPEALAGRVSAGPILAHECVHLARGDLKTRAAERLVADLFWFSPFAWGIRSALDYWREAVVDEAAAHLTGDKIAYAKALTDAARFARPITRLPVAAFILPKKESLKMRLSDLLKETPRQPRRMAAAMGVALLVAVPMACAQGAMIKSAETALPGKVIYTHAVMDKAKLTSAYGLRNDPTTSEPGWHMGIDLAEELGKPAYAPASGEVTFAGEKNGYGKLVVLSLSDGTRLRYGHLSEMLVREGEHVSAGQRVGLIGSSGLTRKSGAHLHFEVWRSDKPWDPQAEAGLVLADALRIMPKSGGQVDVPTVETASKPTAPKLSDTPPVLPGNEEAVSACQKLALDIEKLPRPERWAARMAQGDGENAANGVSLKAGGRYVDHVQYPSPVFPKAAIDSQQNGACLVMLDIDESGHPVNVDASCSDEMFVASAEALPGATFKVTEVNGTPVPVKGALYPLQYCFD